MLTAIFLAPMSILPARDFPGSTVVFNNHAPDQIGRCPVFNRALIARDSRPCDFNGPHSESAVAQATQGFASTAGPALPYAVRS